MKPSDTIRLIILNESKAEADRVISLLQFSGKSLHAQHVDNEETLTHLLQEHTWDLLIGNYNATVLTPQLALKYIRRLDKDLPVILLYDEDDPFAQAEALKMGVADVVNLDDDQHLLLVIQREINNRKDRHARRTAERRFSEAERRSQQLLDSSRDAIAYVQDGFYVYANDSFATLFGFKNSQDIESMPAMDMVVNEEQNNLKNLLKEFASKGEEAETNTLTFSGIMKNGATKVVDLEISNVTYDEEPCIQFLVRATPIDASASNSMYNEEEHSLSGVRLLVKLGLFGLTRPLTFVALGCALSGLLISLKLIDAFSIAIILFGMSITSSMMLWKPLHTPQNNTAIPDNKNETENNNSEIQDKTLHDTELSYIAAEDNEISETENQINAQIETLNNHNEPSLQGARLLLKLLLLSLTGPLIFVALGSLLAGLLMFLGVANAFVISAVLLTLSVVSAFALWAPSTTSDEKSVEIESNTLKENLTIAASSMPAYGYEPYIHELLPAELDASNDQPINDENLLNTADFEEPHKTEDDADELHESPPLIRGLPLEIVLLGLTGPLAFVALGSFLAGLFVSLGLIDAFKMALVVLGLSVLGSIALWAPKIKGK